MTFAAEDERSSHGQLFVCPWDGSRESVKWHPVYAVGNCVALEEGHEVNVFFVDNGVFLAKKGMMENIVAPTGDGMEEHAEKLVLAKVPFYA